MSYEHPNEFLNLDSTQVDNIVNVNITSLNVMTRIILPQMVERKKGAVINISSLSGMMVSPMLAVSIYTSSKCSFPHKTTVYRVFYLRVGKMNPF